MILELVVVVLLADLFTGVVHWWEDTYGRPSWPVVGDFLVIPNLAHHRLGARSLEKTWVGRSGHALAAAIVVQVPLLAVGWWSWHVAVFLLLAAMGNETHAWAHGIGRSPGVVLLQDMGLLQTPSHHARHHRQPFDRHYCTLTLWVNPVLERVGFWRRLEAAIAHFGVHPARGHVERGGL